MNSGDQDREQGRPAMPEPAEVAPQARRIMRLCNKVALATIDRESGAPFLSLTGVATLVDATPALLLSTLAQHTQNLQYDARASLLFDGTGDHANPLTESRVTLTGHVRLSQREEAARRFIMRTQKAFYAGFSDFGFYELEFDSAHFVGGFGTALAISRETLLLPEADIGELAEMEGEFVQQMNAQAGQDVRNIAVNLLKGREGQWLMTGADPEGCDFVLRKERLRLDFPEPVKTASQLRETVAECSKKAALS